MALPSGGGHARLGAIVLLGIGLLIIATATSPSSFAVDVLRRDLGRLGCTGREWRCSRHWHWSRHGWELGCWGWWLELKRQLPGGEMRGRLSPVLDVSGWGPTVVKLSSAG